jgi:hypothetical protein
MLHHDQPLRIKEQLKVKEYKTNRVPRSQNY